MKEEWIILVAVLFTAAVLVIIVWLRRRIKRRMEHIVYIHINSYKVLSDLGMRFDPQYEVQTRMQPLRDYEFHLTYFSLNIERSEGLVDDFWGEHIKSLTAIVGNNGAGKTSALRFLLEAVVSGSGHDMSGFVVTEDAGNHHLNVYHSDDVRVEVEANGIDVQQQGGWPEIPTFVFSGHVNVLSSVEDMMSVELAGMVNATEGYLLTADLQHYGRELATNGQFPLRDYATAFDTQDQWRICNFLAQYKGPLKQQLHLPKYVLVLPNKAGQWSLKHRLKEDDRLDYEDYNLQKEWSFRENRMGEMIYYNIINYMSDGIGEQHYWQGFLDGWNKMMSEQYQGDVVKLFRLFIDNRQLEKESEYRVWLENIYEVIENINIHCKFDEQSLLPYFYFRIDDDDDAMKTFLGWLQGNPIFTASRYFDLRYAHDNDSGSLLSSGEKAMLDMYSRIYEAVISKHQYNSGYIWPTLFIFDEAEIGFHPEWQRSYVKNITLFLEEIAKKATDLRRQYWQNEPEFLYQVILTSHSPIILSDVPKECSIMLKRRAEDDVTVNVSNSRQQTFGTNIFELYRDSFFMEGGLVGEFASAYIQQLDKDIENVTPENKESLKKKVMLVGDRVVRDYLMGKLYAQDKDGLKEYYRKLLQELEDEQN